MNMEMKLKRPKSIVLRPSQILNFFPLLFSACVLAVSFIGIMYVWHEYGLAHYQYSKEVAGVIISMPIVYSIYRWLKIHFMVFEITPDSIRLRKSIWDKGRHNLMMYRIKDTDYSYPWYWMPWSLGSVFLDTSDKSHPRLIIPAIKEAESLHNTILSYSEQQREIKKVTEIDYQ